MNEYNKRFENFCTQIRSSAKGKTPLDLLSELDLALEEASLTGNEVDPALADAYIAIAQEMRELPPAPSGEELAEHFLERHGNLFHHAPNSAAALPSVHRPRRRRVLGILVAVMVVFLALMMSAYGQKAIEYVTKFTDKNLYINSGGASAADLDFDEPDDTGYRSLEEVLSANGITGVCPTWLPGGYELSMLYVPSTPSYGSFGAYYVNPLIPDGSIVVAIDRYPGDVPSSSIPKDPNSEELYRSGGVEHYIMTNTTHVVGAWVNNHCLCTISGTITRQEMKDVIDSIYEGE